MPAMPQDNPVARLAALDSEIWWDTSPLLYADWLAAQGGAIPAAELFHVDGTGAFQPTSVLRGATTNQPLTWQAIEADPRRWQAFVARESARAPGLPLRELAWRLFVEVAAEGADRLQPIFAASDHRYGYVCCQVDPRDLTGLDAMLAQARRIHAARPNLMVKLPGTQEGIEAVRILTAEGIPTNVTLGFTVAQLVAVGEAAQAGLAEARRRGTGLGHWRSCAVMMLGRYEDAPPLRMEAGAAGIPLDDADLRWAGIAIFRQAHRLFQERRYPTRLMAASLRPGPVVDGVAHLWHLEQLAGADAVLTVFPNILEAFLRDYQGRPLEPRIDEPVPPAVLDRLLRLPYFAAAYAEDGLAPQDFVHHPALQITAAAFAEAMDKVEAFAAAHRS
jgi:transaldolase